MRSPMPSFRSELAAYQRQLLSKPREPVCELAVAILNRWIEHPDAEAIWSMLQSRLPPDLMPTASEFAYRVIEYHFTAQQLDDVIEGAPARERKVLTRVKRHLGKRDEAAIAAASVELGKLAVFKKRRLRLLGRQRSAPRTWFMRQWADNFKTACGQPLDEVVCFITEIAFNDCGITLDAVRSARRPSRRSARQPKRTGALDPKNRA